MSPLVLDAFLISVVSSMETDSEETTVSLNAESGLKDIQKSPLPVLWMELTVLLDVNGKKNIHLHYQITI